MTGFFYREVQIPTMTEPDTRLARRFTIVIDGTDTVPEDFMPCTDVSDTVAQMTQVIITPDAITEYCLIDSVGRVLETMQLRDKGVIFNATETGKTFRVIPVK